MDDDDALVLTTEYETMSSIERFWFPSPNLRMRTSTVKRFGGFATATFCTESRLQDAPEGAPSQEANLSNPPADGLKTAAQPAKYVSFFGW
jgi:hypothetical protein